MLRFIIKVAHSFVAIGFLTFFKNIKFHFYCSRKLSVFWINKCYSPSRKGFIKKTFSTFIKVNLLTFSVFEFFYRGVTKHNILIIHKKITYFYFVEFSQLSSFIIFSFNITYCHHGQGNWLLFQI